MSDRILGEQSLEFLEATTDGVVEWNMLNMDSELSTPSLSHAIGPGVRSVLLPHWTYNAHCGDGTVPVNNIVRFVTFGRKCALRSKLRQEFRLRLVTSRGQAGTLDRAHLVLSGDMFQDHETPQHVGCAEFWMALTRPLAPPGKHRPTELPAELAFLKEHEPTEDDLVSRGIESFRCKACSNGRELHDSVPMVFHMDRSDSYQHINTNVHIDQALDYLALLYHNAGGDAGRIRFREITVFYRKPFVPGQAAEVDLELVEHEDRFEGAALFYHCDSDGARTERISTALKARGVLA